MNLDNVKYLLCDLDGTLINFNLSEFVTRYLDLLHKYFSAYSWSENVPLWILEGTDLMLKNDGRKSNQDLFLEYFSAKSGLDRDVVWRKFISFYQNDFDQIRNITSQKPEAIDFIQKAVRKGYRIIIATQPIFPEIAIKKRLNWAGLANIPLELITDISTMHAAKPSPVYFQQIIMLLNAEPSDCMMIGNEAETDMAAVATGIPAFLLVEDGGIQIPPDIPYAGNYHYLASLLNLK